MVDTSDEIASLEKMKEHQGDVSPTLDDVELASMVKGLLDGSDLDSLSSKTIREALESELGVSLAHKTSLIQFMVEERVSQLIGEEDRDDSPEEAETFVPDSQEDADEGMTSLDWYSHFSRTSRRCNRNSEAP